MYRRNKGFTLVELLVVITILGILAAIGLSTFNYSQMKGRDAKRKTNLSQIAESLELYYNDKGNYPASDAQGRIMGCGVNATELCEWGTSEFSNTSVTPKTIYMITLPTDPSFFQYFYVSTGKTFQIYAYLENDKDSSIITPAVSHSCGGGKNCNFGISSTNTTP